MSKSFGSKLISSRYNRKQAYRDTGNLLFGLFLIVIIFTVLITPLMYLILIIFNTFKCIILDLKLKEETDNQTFYENVNSFEEAYSLTTKLIFAFLSWFITFALMFKELKGFDPVSILEPYVILGAQILLFLYNSTIGLVVGNISYIDYEIFQSNFLISTIAATVISFLVLGFFPFKNKITEETDEDLFEGKNDHMRKFKKLINS